MGEAREIPWGYRFVPTSDEILQYLSCKIDGLPLPYDYAIKEIDLYTVQDPGELFEGEEECNVVYTFTKSAENGMVVDRKVVGSNSIWITDEKTVYPVLSSRHSESFIGWAHSLKFITNEKGQHAYSMIEYSLPRKARVEGFVVCKIMKQPLITGSKRGNRPAENKNFSEDDSPQSHNPVLPRPEKSNKNVISESEPTTYTHQSASGSSSPCAEGHQNQQNSCIDDTVPVAPINLPQLKERDFLSNLSRSPVEMAKPSVPLGCISDSTTFTHHSTLGTLLTCAQGHQYQQNSCIDDTVPVAPINLPQLKERDFLSNPSRSPVKLGKPSVPLGYRFNPTREELIDYLSCKAKDKPAQCDGVIKEINLYSLDDPGTLFEEEGEECNVVYVLTRLKKYSKNNNLNHRKAGKNSRWIFKTTSPKPAFGTYKQRGQSRHLNFTTKEKGTYAYAMNEFILDDDHATSEEDYVYTVCEIRRQAPRKMASKKKKSPEDDSNEQ